jgi:hypothetical protein
MDNDTIADWTEIELIKNILFELRRSSAAASGFAQFLVKGTLGFSNDKQKEIIEMLHRETQIIEEVNRWVTVWAVSRNKQEEKSKTDAEYEQFQRLFPRN